MITRKLAPGQANSFGHSAECLLALFILAVVAALILMGCQATRAGYESAPYRVMRADGKFELRDYPALAVVETTMTRSGKDTDGSFNRLFGFITGRNEVMLRTEAGQQRSP